MKKQLSLIALTALFVSFVAFSGVASAQTSSTQIVLFTSPYCSVCQQVDPIVHSVAANNPGVTLAVYDVTQDTGKGVGQAQTPRVSSTPTIIISKNGQQVFRSDGDLVSASELQAAIGTVTVAKATAAPVVKAAAPVVKATATPKTVAQATKPTTPYIGNKNTKVVHLATCYHVNDMLVTNMVGFNTLAQAQAQGYTPCKDCLGAKATATTVAKTVAQPAIEVVTATQTPTTSTQTVPEFSLLGLGAPALVVGAIYLFLRRR